MTLKFYDAWGNLVRSLSAGFATAPVTALSFSAQPYDPSQGDLTISQGAWSAAFNGRSDEGRLLQGGAYSVVAESAQAGAVQRARATLDILGGTKTSLSGLLAWPDPLRVGAGPLLITWTPAQAAELGIYNVAGELVIDLGARPLPPVAWDLKLPRGAAASPGIYFIRARTPGEKKVALAKFALVR